MPIVAPLVGGAIAALIFNVTLHPILRDRFEKIPGAASEGRTVRDERSEAARPD